MKKYNYIVLPFVLASFGLGFSSCSENEDPIVEVPPVEEAFIEINGGGSTFPNMVFVDLSKEVQTAVRRDSWDLAFNSGSEFNVLINGTTGAMAYETEFTDFAQVGADLEQELRSAGSLDLTFSNLDGIKYVDNPSNPLAEFNVLGQAATSAQSAKVFVINRGESGAESKPWKKIKIYRSNNAYIIEHAEVNSNQITSVQISKDEDFNFVYFSFENGKVEVEPKKSEWDFVWTAGTSSTPFPQAFEGTLAYFFQDLTYHNIYGGVSAIQIMEADIPFDSFSVAELSGLELDSENRLVLGSNWRSGGGPNSEPNIRNDRYYIIKDKNGNHYKLRFLSLTSGGERGRPSLEYALVK